MYHNTRKVLSKFSAVVLTSAPVLAFAQATDPVLAAFTDVEGKVTSYSGPLLAIAVIATGIMIGIAWIKKARGASR